MTRVAWLALVGLVSCGTVPRLVAPLRYGESTHVSADDPFRENPPIVDPAKAPAACVSPQTAFLANGVRIVVAERHDFPSISVRLFLASNAFDWDDTEARRLELMGATFLSPTEAGEEANATCGLLGCSVAVLGTHGRLDELMGRLSVLVVTPREPRQAYARRLASAMAAFRVSNRFTGIALWRNAYAAALGESPFANVAGTEFSLESLERMRDAVLTPQNATVVIAGDVSFDEAKSAAERSLAKWRQKSAAPSRPVAPETHEQSFGPRLVLVNTYGLTQLVGAVAALGPARDSPDAAPFSVAAQILGGGMTSEAYRYVREDMSAAYVVGGQVDWLGRSSVFLLAGLTEPEKTVDALGALLHSVRVLAQSEPAMDHLERAKSALIARERQLGSSSAGMSRSLEQTIAAGGPVDPCEFARRLESVSAADIQRVARKHFVESNLHVIAVGPAEVLAPRLAGLQLGPAQRRDGFARDELRE